jgi:hypothetical protein
MVNVIKPVNRYTSNEFHDWQRENLPGQFIIQDLDTWSMVISDTNQNFEPLFLVELKRSFIDPEKWEPFRNDINNYLAIFKFSQKANVPLMIIYFKKGVMFNDDTKIAIFKVLNVDKDSDKWIECSKKIISCKEFKQNFPNNLL